MTVLTLAACALLQSPVPRPIAEYTVRLADPSQRRATVAIELSRLPDGPAELELSMAERYAFTAFHEARVFEPVIAVVGERSMALERAEPFVWRVPRSGASAVSVVYDAPLDQRDWEEVGDRSDYEMPLVADEHAMLVGGALFATPRLDGLELRVRFELPEGWPVLCPWTEAAPGVYAPPTGVALKNSLIALGRWETHELEVGKAKVISAFAGNEKRLAPKVAPLGARIVAEEFVVFGGAPLERYLFLFVPSRVRGFAGSAKDGAMVLSIGADTPTDAVIEPAAHLVAHEFFHTWGAARYECPDELRFFNEGFTDYFAYETARRVGAIDALAFEATVGEKIAQYERAARDTGLSLKDAGGPAFFEGRAAYDQTYAGGLVLAVLCEKALRAKSEEHSGGRALDAFLRAFNGDSRWSVGGAAPTLDDFIALLAVSVGDEFAAKVRKLIETPGADLASALVELGCAVERTSKPAPMSLRANLDGTRLLDLDPNCAAALIGVRAGDALVEVNGTPVTNAAECYAAFARAAGERLRVRLMRAGAEVSLDAALPRLERIRFAWNA